MAKTHALSSMCDAMIAVALAGSIFFSIDPGAARWRVALYLVLTIAPFAVVTPLIGPAVDRIRGGRRLMIVFTVLGRADDVLNVAGHRIGTMEVESALVGHASVAEAAVVGKSHEIKGQAIAAFVTLKDGLEGDEDLVRELKKHVDHTIGAIARPETIIFAADLPKTRSGKIMRRLLKDVAEGKALGDTTTLADPGVVEQLKSQYEADEA